MSKIAQLAGMLRERISPALALVAKAAGKLAELVERLRQIVSPFESEAVGFFCAFVLSFGTIYCLATAHGIPVSGIGMFFGCAVISASAVAFIIIRQVIREKDPLINNGYILDAVAPLVIAAIMFLARKPIILSARVALSISADIYNLYFPDTPPGVFLPDTATLFMLCLAAFPAVTAAWTVIYAKTPFLAAAGSVPIFSVSIIMFEQLPSAWAVCMFIFALGLIALSHRARRHNEDVGFVHTVRIAPVLALFVLVLALIVDPSDYKTPVWLENVQNRTYAVFGQMMDSDTYNEFNYVDTTVFVGDETMELDELSSQQKLGIKVMSVRMSGMHSSYLRAVSYAGYENNEWQMLPEEAAARINAVIESPLTGPLDESYSIDSVLIRTEEEHPYIFIPYYAGEAPVGGLPYGDACIENTGSLSVYQIDRVPNPSRNTFTGELCDDREAAEKYRALVEGYYLDIPETTAEALRSIAAGWGIITTAEAAAGGISLEAQGHCASVVERLAQCVRTCAYYSLEPSEVPDGADFPVWFLTEAESGYCTHFAASGALMLRAIGIPARLTTGYYVARSDDEWQVVTSDDAHAWVEYYLPHTGWQVLEVTGRYAAPEEETPSSTAASSTASSTSAVSSTASSATSGGTTSATSAPGEASSSDSQQGPLSPSDRPGDGYQSEGEKQPTGSVPVGVTVILVIVLIIAAVCGILVLTRQIINERRRQRFTTGSNNRRVIEMWDNILRLTEALKTEPSGEIEDIMLKARFSQHTVSDAELAQVSRYMQETVNALSSTRDYAKRLIDKYFMFYY